MVVPALGFSLAPSRGGSIGWKKSGTTQARPAAIAARSSPIGDKRTLRGHSKLVATNPRPTSELREPKLPNPKGFPTRRASQPEGLPNPLRTDTLNRYHALS